MSFLAETIITVTLANTSYKRLEAMRHETALYCGISSLVFMKKNHHSSSLNPSINCFVVGYHFDYFSQFSNCKTSDACVITAIKSSSQLHPLKKSLVYPCNLTTKQLGQIFTGRHTGWDAGN